MALQPPAPQPRRIRSAELCRAESAVVCCAAPGAPGRAPIQRGATGVWAGAVPAAGVAAAAAGEKPLQALSSSSD